jgi:hypothetical protein
MRVILGLVIVVQLVVLIAGLGMTAPPLFKTLAQTPFQAPSTLKLIIEIAVFGLEVLIKTIILLLVLLIPAWAGLVYVMAKRSREGYFVDITPDGVVVGNPVDRFFIKRKDITKIKSARFFPAIPSISIYCGLRRVTIRKLILVKANPEKKPLVAWLQNNAPGRWEVRKGMLDLKRTLEAMVAGEQIN